MKVLSLKISLLSIFCFLTCGYYCNAQQGSVIINQDKNITKLMDVKKEMSDNDTNRYKIQIYSGNRNGAESAKSNFESTYDQWTPIVQFETPNYKIWVGNFVTRLEADRALKKIKSEFPSAFIFKPKK
ncbi:translation initiation factor IF-2 [Pseudalgibacter alginicilyticus]|uniref:Translation initiation factor IF-2 n=1 Tax=Pseudalgibacter alginicilyticus TaxID=1736674 RepID=A0A0N7HYR3_9FLAO|nr:SPOR domain-containing protein [Pseudalgibacter alginicilyticus]ALJ05974.1 translation initiation factor IF-2 [Pseudalgibacter alginicilyticus]